MQPRPNTANYTIVTLPCSGVSQAVITNTWGRSANPRVWGGLNTCPRPPVGMGQRAHTAAPSKRKEHGKQPRSHKQSEVQTNSAPPRNLETPGICPRAPSVAFVPSAKHTQKRNEERRFQFRHTSPNMPPLKKGQRLGSRCMLLEKRDAPDAPFSK